MHGRVEIKLDADDLITSDEEWNFEEQRSDTVVRFFGIEVGRYPEHSDHGVPEELQGHALEARTEKLVRALWALGDPEGDEA